MYEAARRQPGLVVTVDRDLDREFERLVHETSDLAVRVAFSVLRRREDAEEVAQEALIRAHRRFSRLRREPERFRAWIVRVTWRLAIDRWRTDRRRTHREQTAAPAESGATVEQIALEAERAARLWRAVDDLPQKLRLVIVLAALEEHDIAEVARLLGVPEGTVKSRLFLARKRLAERLQCLVSDSTER
jgi:RNA polymerase sigma-70 factor, ECF subfamily